MARQLNFTSLVVPNGGINETLQSQQIEDNQWQSGLNVEALPDGVRRRNGSVESNAIAVSGAIQGIADYRLSDATTARHVVFADGKLYVNTSGTMAEDTHADGAFATGADVHVSHTVGHDRLFFTDNAAVSRKFYVFSSTDYYENEGIAPPTAVITAAGTADVVNFLEAGVWEVDYYYWNNDLGIPSDRKYQGADAASVTLGSDEKLRITNIPAAVVRTGDRATHIRIETRLIGTDLLFRFQKEITIGTTTVDIDATDERLVEAEYEHAVAPVHKVKTVAENRQFIGNIAGAPYRLMFSSIVGTTPYYESYRATNFRDFGKGDGDYITSLFFIAPRTLIIGFKNSIWAIDPRNPATSDRFNISRNIGIANHNAGIVIGRRLFFVSDAEENKGLFMYEPGAEPRPVTGIDDTFKGLNQNRLDNVSCAHYSPDDVRHQWWILCSKSAAITQNRILVFDYQLNAWTVFDPANAGGVLGTVEETGVSTMYLGGNDGVEYTMDSSGATDDNGTDFDGTVTLKAFDFGQQGVRKRMRFVDYLVKQQTGGSINLTIERDHGVRTDIFANLSHEATATSMLWNTGVWGTNTWSGSSGLADTLSRASLRGRASVFTPKLQGFDPWQLKGLSFGIQETGKR